MGYPSIAATASTNIDNTGQTSRNANLPSGIQAGDLLLMQTRAGGTVATSTPSGWTLIESFSSNGQTYVFGRIADGNEGSTVTVETASTARMVIIVHRIIDWFGNLNGVKAAFTTGVDPPELTPGWGQAKTLWIAGISGRRTDWGSSAYPTGFSLVVNVRVPDFNSSLTSSVRLVIAQRDNEVDKEDPSAFTTGSNIDNPHAWTIGVRPKFDGVESPAVALPILLGLPTLQVIDPGIPVVLFSPTVLLGLDCGVPTFTGTFISQVTTDAPGLPLGVTLARALQELDLLNQDLAAPVLVQGRLDGAPLTVRSVQVRKTTGGVEVSVSTPDPGPFAGVMSVRAGYLLPEFGAVLDELARVTISRVRISRTTGDRDSFLSGGDQRPMDGAVRERPLRRVSFRSVADGRLRIRCQVDVYANPGDLGVLPSGESFRIREVVYVLTPGLAFMEVVG